MYHEKIVSEVLGERAGDPAQATAFGRSRRFAVYLRPVSGGESARVCLRRRYHQAAADLLRGAGTEGLRAVF